MKRKKSIKQKLAEVGYTKPNLEKKISTFYSAPPGVRTLDTLIKSQVLCQLS